MSDVYRLQYLRGMRLKVFLAVADRIIPPDPDAPGGGTMATAGVVDWAMARLPSGLRAQLLGLLFGIQALGMFFGLKPFTMNSDAAKDRQLAWMESGPIQPFRMGFFGLKSYVCMGYYTREDIWPAINYGGPIQPDREFPDETIRKLCRAELEVRE